MAHTDSSLILKQALWQAHGKRCPYCDGLLLLRDCEIDHVVPRTASGAIESHGLPADFDIDGLDNFLPCHGRCNRLKGSKVYAIGALMHFLEMARHKKPRAEQLIEKYTKALERDDAEAQVTMIIERGLLSPDDVRALVDSYERTRALLSDDTYLLTFSLLMEEVLAERDLPPDVPRFYPLLCDWLQDDLVSRLSRDVQTAFLPLAVEDARNGETFGIRVLFVRPRVDALPHTHFHWWEVFHEGSITSVYGREAGSRFLRRLAQDCD